MTEVRDYCTVCGNRGHSPLLDENDRALDALSEDGSGRLQVGAYFCTCQKGEALRASCEQDQPGSTADIP